MRDRAGKGEGGKKTGEEESCCCLFCCRLFSAHLHTTDRYQRRGSGRYSSTHVSFSLVRQNKISLDFAYVINFDQPPSVRYITH